MSPQIFGEKIEPLKAGLDFASAKGRAISANIANIETPGYKRFKVILDKKLGRINRGSLQSSKTHPHHISGKKSTNGQGFQIVRDDDTIQRVDGNNVDIDHELAELSANAIYFTALSRFIAKNFSGLRTIISEGRR